jgi:hypothetical protein
MEIYCTLFQYRVFLSMFHSSPTSKIWYCHALFWVHTLLDILGGRYFTLSPDSALAERRYLVEVTKGNQRED